MTDTVLGGRYRLISPIAAGGMGEVWRAEDELLGREVAIKLLGRHVAGDATFRDRFRSEARITAGLTDPGIAQVFDYGESDGLAYLVMELVRGEPLSAILARNGALGPDVTLDVVEQTARGLYAAHRAGVIHRDVKPGNLLVTGTGQVKITDFGIARALEAAPLTATGTILGTAQYVSPEQASGTTLTPASDIYSLGVVAYECLAGRPPFRAETAVALALRHLNDTPPPLPATVPAPVAALVTAMLAKDPAARPETGPVLLDRVRTLRDALAGTGPSTAALGSLTDPQGFPAAGGAGRTTPPAAPGLTAPLGEPGGAGTTRPAATAPLGPVPPATRRAPAGVPSARTRRPGGPEGPAGGRRRRTTLLLVSAGCAAAVGIGVLAFTAAHIGEPPPDPGETAAPVSPTPSPSPKPSPARTNRSEIPRTQQPPAPAASDEPSAVPSATVSTSASTQTPTPASSPTSTSTPTPTSTPATEPSETPPPTEAPPDTNPPDEGE
ncbi:serine/threonine-protein kinase [Microbispora hainanensis]|uniref:non-specific serine/threonine protein kinase n=1 Tax=Microbispora hainanensis TaxID=568844 RepID=A0A544YWE8_9ACTN|nr:serine/threonine-protein kinase [Microbispora hainanensis]TQS21093.1 protein kinase [Microbispora hainanensis]